MTRENPHVPRPREGVLPGGDLAVVQDRQLSDDAVTVPAADRPLYELLREILADEHVRDTMPARLAVACDDLVDVRETVADIDRGVVDIAGVGYGMSYCLRVKRAIEAYRDREPLRLAAVGCSGSKDHTDGRLPARERYAGAYWTCKRRYGEVVADDWRILSAEHGVLDPATPIEDYERTPEDLRGVPVDAAGLLPSGAPVETLLDRWALDVYEGLDAWLDAVAGGVDPRDVALEVLIGRRYREPLAERGVFDALRGPAGLSVSFPFQEVEQCQGGNGHQMGWLTDEVDRVAATDGGE